jgi:AraC family transcriptional regulator
VAQSTEIDAHAQPDVQSPLWARSILPAPASASRQWAHALARRGREPARVAGFIEPASNVHHIVMAPSVGFQFEARELGSGKWRHYDVAPGELCVIGAGSAPSELSWVSRGRERTMEVIDLYIDPTGLQAKGGPRSGTSLEPAWRVLRDPLITQLVDSITRELDGPESGQELFGDLATMLLGVQLERAHGVSGSASHVARRGGLTPFVLQRVREYVSAHLAGAIRLQRLAALAGLSPFHFSRAFKVSTGMAPHAYVLHCRIVEAKRLLSCTTLAVADIARRTGFSSPGQLSERFRASTGTTPSAFRGLARR